jgi:hypothetical protein
LAARGHAFEKTFSEPCLAEPCNGALKEPAGLAVNEATGQVYVVDKGANRVARFSSGGSYEAEFNGSGTLPGEGKAAGSNPGETGSGTFNAPDGIAIDNTCARVATSELEACETADPSHGDIYVVDTGNGVVDKYAANGAYIGQISENGEGRFTRTLDGAAVGAHGEVWVYQENRVLNGYVNLIANEFSGTLEVKFETSTFGRPGVAVDSKGRFYVRHTLGVDAVGRVAQADSVGKVLQEEVDNEKSTAVAVDSSNDVVFIDNIKTIGVFTPAGELVERLGEEKGEEHLAEGAGVAVSAAAESVYVADAAAKQIVVFGPVQPSAPSIESQSASEILPNSATLSAEINPRSEPGEAATEYRVEFGACAGACSESGYEASAPVPEGRIAPDFEVHPVSVPITNLKANTTYHFRVVARNVRGPVEGPEGTFTTQARGGELILPDDRGWELVSPPDKQGALIEPITEVGVIQAAADGNAITYLANAPLSPNPEGAANKSQALSSRSSDRWSSRDVSLPHVSATGSPVGSGQEYRFFDPALSLGVVQPFGEFNAGLSNEASEPTAYLRTLSPSCDPSCYRPLVTSKPGFANVPPGTEFGEEARCRPSSEVLASLVCGPEFLGASDDLNHVVLRAAVALNGGAGGEQLYEWTSGQLLHVSILPSGEPAPEGFGESAHFGLHNQATRRAISTDGARIEWEAAAALYQRDTTSEETVQLDGGEGCVGCESGGGEFQIANAHGSRVFFTDIRQLTSDSGAEPEGSNHEADLYECWMVIEGGKQDCDLSDLTPANGEEGANVQGGVLGASEDGEYLYFVARGIQSGENAQHQSPQAGKPNLYLRHGGSTSFVATLAEGDRTDWNQTLSGQPTRVSPNGRYLELMSEARLTGYDNRDVTTGKPAAEVYLYDASTAGLECASCDPTGARPVGVEYFRLEPGSGGLVGGPTGIWQSSALVAANVPGWTAIGAAGQQKSRYQPSYLDNQGRLFFDTANALVTQDSNNTQDVYEYEPPTVGNCTPANEAFSSRSGGCVGLISSGRSSLESAFLDASESGDDVFFLTAARLSAIDTDNALDIYDAHVCTDSPCIVYTASESSQCTVESSCRPPAPPQPAIFGAPPSVVFQGPGNFPPQHSTTPRSKTPEEIRIEKLNRALKACRAKKNKKKRVACERSVRTRYAKPGSRVKAKKKTKGKNGAKRRSGR